MRQRHLLFWVVLVESGCATSKGRECEMPPLGDQSVTEIADAFLQTQHMDPKFRATAEKRIRSYGCKYAYEESEKLDSLGAGIIVIVDRNKKVVNFFGSN